MKAPKMTPTCYRSQLCESQSSGVGNNRVGGTIVKLDLGCANRRREAFTSQFRGDRHCLRERRNLRRASSIQRYQSWPRQNTHFNLHRIREVRKKFGHAAVQGINISLCILRRTIRRMLRTQRLSQRDETLSDLLQQGSQAGRQWCHYILTLLDLPQSSPCS